MFFPFKPLKGNFLKCTPSGFFRNIDVGLYVRWGSIAPAHDCIYAQTG